MTRRFLRPTLLVAWVLGSRLASAQPVSFAAASTAPARALPGHSDEPETSSPAGRGTDRLPGRAVPEIRVQMVREEPPGPPAEGSITAREGPATGGEGRGSRSRVAPTYVAGRSTALRAVVRLRDRRGLVCTATVVSRDGAVFLLTAAHCLFNLGPSGTLGARRASLTAEGVGELDPAGVSIDPRFEACAAEHRTWEDCAGNPATRDVAWVALAGTPRGVSPWGVCAAHDQPDDVTIFGYGLNGRALPRLLLQGAFRVQARRAVRLRVALGVGVRIDGGDSGGPVISSDDDFRLDARVPCVRYVAVAVRVRDPDDPGDRSRALLEPMADSSAGTAGDPPNSSRSTRGGADPPAMLVDGRRWGTTVRRQEVRRGRGS